MPRTKKISELSIAATPDGHSDVKITSRYDPVTGTYSSYRTGGTGSEWVTGRLVFQDPAADTGIFADPLASGDLNVASTDNNALIYLQVSSADPTASDLEGGVVAGRLKYSVPVLDEGGPILAYSSKYAGVYLTAYDTVTIRKNDGTAGMDFFLGNHIYIVSGSGVVAIAQETGDVVFRLPDGASASVAGTNQVVKATLVQTDVTETSPGVWTHDQEVWLLEGDLTGTGGGGTDRSALTVVSSDTGFLTLDYANGDYFTTTLTENIDEISIQNQPNNTSGGRIYIRFNQDETGNRTVNWPNDWVWDTHNTEGVLSTGALFEDVLTLTWFGDKNTWYVSLVKDWGAWGA
jgi:hypothetical protein